MARTTSVCSSPSLSARPSPFAHTSRHVTNTSFSLSQQAYRHFRTALALWPKDNLRPETQFKEIIQRGVERRYTAPNVDEANELKQANALFALANDRFKKRVSDKRLALLVPPNPSDQSQFPLNGQLLKPASQPTYFQDLLRELEEAPTRGWLKNMSKKLSGMFRFE
ncbi:uncharacterized protein LY79DRAFT_552190 [Colletotrichum navitas]|uniref:Uncharacterized protein n=1 Tax=Colletotrichum navitas TaxID=681940 RepID=A0AAD8V5E3_9PEZI|nr:uncharacterized protein LY79DRAFT_552190 [Colletotrichum navitas]KAK1593539.1 hypothetical protein LY79DRAFT_552190 [Colletotrichum navitas]